MNLDFLFIVIFPLLLGIAVSVFDKKDSKIFSLCLSIIYFLGSIYKFFSIDFTANKLQLVSYQEFLGFLGGSLNFSVDGLSYLMWVLTNFVVVFVIMKSWSKNYSSKFYSLVFLMQFALIGVFTSMNLLTFYIFWELALFPIYFIVYYWGEGKDKLEVVKRFFIYTFVGSIIMLGGIVALSKGARIPSLDINYVMTASLDNSYYWIFTLCMFVGLGVKIPVFLLHSWQARTYQTASAEGTMLLSGIMLKMGIYGMYRWFLPLQDNMPENFQYWLVVLCVVGVIYGALIALRRNDLKLIAAFSSLSHVGLIVAGLLCLNYTGFQGSIMQMLVHGINIVGLFYVIDLIQEHFGSRDIEKLGGIANRYPLFTAMAFIIVLGAIAVPLTSGFPGEMLLLFSVFKFNSILGVIAGLSIIIGAAYMLRVFQLSFMGEESTLVKKSNSNIERIHYIALGTICLLVLGIGIFPQYLLNFTEVLSQYMVLIVDFKN